MTNPGGVEWGRPMSTAGVEFRDPAQLTFDPTELRLDPEHRISNTYIVLCIKWRISRMIEEIDGEREMRGLILFVF